MVARQHFERLQQHLPFTVLKLLGFRIVCGKSLKVATALTVYGIETLASKGVVKNLEVATALTVYGIETSNAFLSSPTNVRVATALTVYGIETDL